jgi:CheY-like chemotaxis protein
MAKILIAEDERDIRDLISFTLTFAGHTIIAAVNGEDAVEKARQNFSEIALILMDVRMPRMTGYEACEIMKADPQLKDIPVVFLSAKGQDSEIKTGMDVGAAEYLLKPFAPTELTQRVSELLVKYGRSSI